MIAVPSLLAFLLTCTLTSSSNVFEFDRPSDVIRAMDGKIRGARSANEIDFIFGGLFPIHKDAEGGGSCGEVRLEKGVERMEAMLYAIDVLNNDSTLLPGIKIGYDIRDTCASENIGLDESLDIIIAGNHLNVESCSTFNFSTGNASDSEFPQTSAVIGAASSGVSVPVATLLRLFKVPQVSYASSSARLNNRDRYEYFFRTIPADSLQAAAMIELCLHFNWMYVSIVYTNDFYGEPGKDEFETLALENGICIDVNVGINADFTESDFKNVADKLINSDDKANVVVLFTSQEDANDLFTQLNGTNRTFLWIASDSWANALTLVHRFNETLAGHYGILPHTDVDNGFMNYFSMLTLENNKRNPWYQEYYEAYVGCGKSNVSCPRNVSVPNHNQKYKQEDKIPLVIDAVYSVAHALQNFFNDHCQPTFVWNKNTHMCDGQSNELNGPMLLKYLQNVSFISLTGRKVYFDAFGNAEGKYEIFNYQKINEGYELKSVGIWDGAKPQSERLVFSNNTSLQFGLSSNGVVLTELNSGCQDCQTGQYKQHNQGECCARCENCLGKNYSNSSFAQECNFCPDGFWGNDPLVGSNSCVPFKESYIQYNKPFPIVLMILALIGILSVVFTAIVMGIYWNTPIMKSSGREQMTLLLVGISISFISTFIFVSKPSTAICVLQRLCLWFCFSLITGALLVKLIRIARIFLRKGTSSRPKFIEPQYQILFTFVVVGVEMVLLAISLGVASPVPREEQRNDIEDSRNVPTKVISCGYPNDFLLAMLVLYNSIIILTCNILAIITIKFPENFNESKYVASSTFTIGVIWLSFISSYIATEHELRTAVVSLALNMTSFAVLLCMFGPRIFIMLFLPNKNTTTTQITTSHITRKAGDLTSVSVVKDSKCVWYLICE